MTDFENEEYDKILEMKDGESLYTNMCNDGGALIHKYWDYYFLFEIPLFGGDPMFYKAYKNIEEMISVYTNWT